MNLCRFKDIALGPLKKDLERVYFKETEFHFSQQFYIEKYRVSFNFQPSSMLREGLVSSILIARPLNPRFKNSDKKLKLSLESICSSNFSVIVSKKWKIG